MKSRIFFTILMVFVTLVAYLLLSDAKPIDGISVEGFTPINDVALAEKYAPIILVDTDKYYKPERLLYRMSSDDQGNIYIAFHPVWPREVNYAKGLMPFLSRNIYTGGLSLQRYMFGKGDVETIEFLLDSKGNLQRISYETAESYSEKDFSVKHKKVEETGDIPQVRYFNIISWNNMLEMVTEVAEGLTEVELKPEYFTTQLWKDYRMTKEGRMQIQRNRAHYVYETEFVNP